MNHHITPDACTACTSCLVQCPVARVSSEFLGPRLIGPAWERFRRLGMPEDASLHYCSNCKNCDITCPQGVTVAHFNVQARIEQCRKEGLRPRDWLLAHGDVVAAWLRHVPAALKNVGMNNPLSRTCLDWLGIPRQASLPAFAPASFEQCFRKLRQPASSRKVAFFPGCYVNNYDPQTGLDLVWLLNRAGYEVLVPSTVCCGLPLLANGFADDARARTERNLALFSPLRERGLPIITACPSCALTFNSDFEEFFPELVAQHGLCPMGDAQQFVLDCVNRGELGLPPEGTAETGAPLRLAYHAPCHLRASGHGLPGLELLRRLPGVSVTNTNAGCCGQSGSYGFKKEHYDIAQAVGQPLFRAIRDSKATLATTECGTCRVQIMHGCDIDCTHPLHVVRQQIERQNAMSARQNVLP